MSDDIKALTPDEVKTKVVEDYGFDEEVDKEKIDKIVNERIESQKALSGAIEQKSKYRQTLVERGLIDPKTFEPIEKKEKEFKKTNTEQNFSEDLVLEKSVLLNSGCDMEDLKLLSDLQKIREEEGLKKSLTELKEDSIFKAHFVEKQKAKEAEKASLPPSKGGTAKDKKPDFINKETGRFDHKAHKKYLENEIRNG